MTAFWLFAALMLLLSSVFFIIPFYLKKNKDDAVSRDELNKALYQERVQELKKETKEGLIDDQDELQIELKQSLLDDIPITQPIVFKDTFSTKLPLLVGVLFLCGLSLVLYFQLGHYSEVIAWQKNAARLPELSEKLMSESADAMTEQEMNDLVLSLRTKLQQTPNDAMGWLLLGKIALANRDIQTAQSAMEKAYRLTPDNIEMKLGYAQSLMLTGDETNQQTARNLLTQVIKKDHSNLQAFSLLAFDAFERGEFEKAISMWSIMKQSLPKDDNRILMLDRSIERAKIHGNIEPEKSISLNIELDPRVILPKNGVLIVSVHTPDGASMPIAAKQLAIDSFPVQVVLTDIDSMIPERKLSSLNELKVKARIDSDANVMTKEGDWFGESPNFNLGETSSILIDKQY